MKKIYFKCAVFAAISLLFILPVNSNAEERPEFDTSSVIVQMKPRNEVTVFGYDTFASVGDYEELFAPIGITEVTEIGASSAGGDFSAMSEDEEGKTLRLSLAEPAEENVLAAIEWIEQLDTVEYAQPNYCYYLDSVPNDLYYRSGYQYALAKIGADYIWNMNIDCSDMVVAVLDSGMLTTHYDLAGNLWTNPNEIAGNGVDDDRNGYIDDVHGWDFVRNYNEFSDSSGHGTHVAGIVSAVTGNSIGVASLAGNAKIVPLRIFNDEGNTTTDYMVNAVSYVRAMGFKVANCSWGGSTYDKTLKRYMSRCTDTVFTVAAGNDSSDNDETPVYPAGFGLDNIISVASTDRSDSLSSFSNYGKDSVDIAAPGTNIFSTLYTDNSSYGYKSGTSMAAPLVASAAAVLRTVYPKLSAKNTVSYLLQSADTISGLKSYVNKGRRLNINSAIELLATPAPTAVPTPTPTPTPTTTPTPTPTPKPTPMPEASGASLTEDNGYLILSVEFDADILPSADEIKAYAVYRNNDNNALVRIEEIELDTHLTAQIPSDGGDYDISVYVWSRNMQPLCGVLKADGS